MQSWPIALVSRSNGENGQTRWSLKPGNISEQKLVYTSCIYLFLPLLLYVSIKAPQKYLMYVKGSRNNNLYM